MKLKGVNPFEQHVEKIVLVVVGAVFLGVLAAQFLREPNRVTVGGQAYAPGRAFEPARERAERVRSLMAQTDVDLPEIPRVDLAEQFLERREAPVAPVTALAELGRALQVDEVAGTGPRLGTEPVAALEVPRATTLVAHPHRATVDPFEVERTAALKAYLPEEQPFDVATVSVEGRFDGRALRQGLTESGPDGAAAIPAVWWRGGVEIFSIVLHREELTETGDWTNLTVVEPVPGRWNPAEEAKQVRSPRDLDELVQDVRSMASEIRRPRYLRTIAGLDWMPPAQASKARMHVRSGEIDRLLRQRSELEGRETQLKEEISQLEGEGGRRGPGGVVGGGTRQEDGRRLQQLQRELQQTQGRLTTVKRQLVQAGHVELREEDEETEKPLLESDSVRIWAHDVTAEPGKTYRYRFEVGINNPAFGREAALVAEQQDLAGHAIIYSRPSEWSDPVYVPADEYFFVYSAQPEGRLGQAYVPARAMVEVYRFFYGYYRQGRTQLEPGDAVAVQVRLPDPEFLLIHEITLDPEGEEGPHGGRNGAAIRDPEEMAQRGDVQEWTEPIVVRHPAFLLDVTEVPGTDAMVVYLRGENGSIVRRSPRDDRRSEVYQFVSYSAAQGALQGAPEPEPEPEPVRPGRREEREPPEPDGGSPGSG